MPEVLVQPLLAAVLAAVAAGPVGALALVRRDTYAAAAISHGCFAGLGLFGPDARKRQRILYLRADIAKGS